MAKGVTEKSKYDKVLSDAYYRHKNPSSYGGINKLVHLKKKNKNLSRKKIEQWLEKQEAYTLHRPARRKFARRPTIVSGTGQQLQADLIDMQKYKAENDGNSFILTVIDVFSKFAWTSGVRNKSGTSIAAGLNKILIGKKYSFLQTDKGKEFYNANVKTMLNKHKITHFSTENDDIKASIVERFNRTIQNKLFRWFTKSKSYRWIDVISKLTHSYNNSFHRSIKMKPIDVGQENSEEVWLNLYGGILNRKSAATKIKVDDPVRISRFKHVFSKGYDKNWSTEIFFVDQVNNTTPITFNIRDQQNERIVGSYYQHELQKVALPATFEIEEVLKTRKRKGNVEYFVKYQGYPPKFNEWISKNQVLT